MMLTQELSNEPNNGKVKSNRREGWRFQEKERSFVIVTVAVVVGGGEGGNKVCRQLIMHTNQAKKMPETLTLTNANKVKVNENYK